MDLNDNNPMTANGDFVARVSPGKPYLLTLYGTWDGGTITVSHACPITGTTRTPSGGAFTDDTEVTVIAPVFDITLTLAGATVPATSIIATLTPLKQ